MPIRSQTFEARRLPTTLAMLLLLLTGCQPQTDVDGVRAQDEVLGMLRARGEVPVMVALVEPDGYADEGADMDRIRSEIARMQADVLASLDSTDYRSRSLFGSIPAMSGVLLSERGLERLRSSPHVQRVDLDPEGTGAR